MFRQACFIRSINPSQHLHCCRVWCEDVNRNCEHRYDKVSGLMVTCSFVSDLLDLMELYIDLALTEALSGGKLRIETFVLSLSYLHGLACNSTLASFIVTKFKRQF